MEFLKIFLRGITLVPGIVQGLEAAFELRSGTEKKAAAVEMVGAAINIADAVSSKQIADSAKFTDGLSTVIDGVVTCLNASIWAKS
jgi:hypothetical protein